MANTIQYKIAGSDAKSITVPTVEKSTENPIASAASTAEWMVRIDDLTASSRVGFLNHCELHGWYAENSCETSGATVGFWNPSTVLKHSELVIIIPVMGFMPKLENSMNKKNALSEVEIIRVGELVATQTILFEKCYISSIQQELERVIVKMNITKKTNTVRAFDATGNSAGQIVSFVDYSSGAVEI
ncbi:MAG: hypothetical protein COY39_02680 [Alphaproteobacteria bacterium CG_4_10_14_0_8_um_filter_37_21]|nr:MAG: hypothetical protein COY39_02680 [Alphaproteobacteria bacterium CG_4_10_14_0_8_um_filter_37_21]